MEIRLLVLQNPSTTEENEHWCLIQANWYKSDEKYISQLGI